MEFTSRPCIEAVGRVVNRIHPRPSVHPGPTPSTPPDPASLPCEVDSPGEVSRSEASKYAGGKLQFLVKGGFPKAEWLPAKQLQEDLSPDTYRALRTAMKVT